MSDDLPPSCPLSFFNNLFLAIFDVSCFISYDNLPKPLTLTLTLPVQPSNSQP